MAAILESEWSSFSETYITEEAEFMTQLLNNYPYSNDLQLGIGSNFELASTFSHGGYESTVDEILLNYSDTSNSDSYIYNGRSSSTSNVFHSLHYENCYYMNESHIDTTDDSMTVNFSLGTEKIMGCSENSSKGDNEIENNDCLINREIDDERNIEDCKIYKSLDSLNTKVPPETKKRTRNSIAPKNERNVKFKKCSKLALAKKEEKNNELNVQSSSSTSSETSYQELKGKTRASRGTATDPQSLYARKRRERINELLRILQNIVPNGTKIDISTMLEEAVQYVKFLQLQIKLLSSDDHWMYAPLAYNGMDIGLDLNTNMQKFSSKMK